MTTFNTGNPIGSTDARDLSDNAENFDKALGTLSSTWKDRLGVTRDSFEGRLAKGSFYRVGTFAAGYKLTNMRQTLEYGGHEYSWAGAFPKVVSAGSTPGTSGGIGAGAWVDRTDVTLRSELAGADSQVMIGGLSAGFISKNQTRVSAVAYGVPNDGITSAVDALQEMIDLGLRIWLDEGNYLIDKTLLYIDGMDIKGPGTLYIKSDENFTKIAGNHFRNDTVISAFGDIRTDTYTIKMKCKMHFLHSAATAPAYPVRFTGLRNSVIDLDFTAESSGNVTDTNMPDFYYNNRDVLVKGSYILTHHNTDNTGGMWVRDINIGPNANSLSVSVVIGSATYIENNGVDEALAFFNPSNGGLRNCGVLSGVRILGRGIGLSFLNFSGDNGTVDSFNVFAENCEVETNGLRINQACVKYSFCNPTLTNVTARISGFDDPSNAGFYAGFRCAADRQDGMRANLTACNVYLLAGAQPTGSIYGYDGSASISDCETKHYGIARFTNCVSNNKFVVRGGFYPDATSFAITNCTRVYTPRVLAQNRFNSITYLKGLDVAKTEAVTTDSNGRATITHNIGAVPSFISVGIVDSGGAHTYAVEYDYPTDTIFQIRVYNKTTNAKAGVGTFVINWKAEE